MRPQPSRSELIRRLVETEDNGRWGRTQYPRQPETMSRTGRTIRKPITMRKLLASIIP